jgi:hypothetical protein
MLFTFLYYDNVSWNNNNAEHAIKSFVKYRRFADGTGTEDSIRDYLVILSICLSCQYRGIDFLKVLLGKEQRDFGLPEGMRFWFRPRVLCAPQTLNLNETLPRLLHRIGVRFHGRFAAGLWSVRANSKELELALAIVVRNFDEMMGAREAITVAAMNARFQEPEAGTGLTGEYVVLSLNSGRGRLRQVRSLALPTQLTERHTGVGFEQVYAFAKSTGGAAIVRNAPGRRTIVTGLHCQSRIQPQPELGYQTDVGQQRRGGRLRT